MNKEEFTKKSQYGFFDPVSKQFFLIPAKSEEEFQTFLSLVNTLDLIKPESEFLGQNEEFDDFDFVVEEIKNTPHNYMSK